MTYFLVKTLIFKLGPKPQIYNVLFYILAILKQFTQKDIPAYIPITSRSSKESSNYVFQSTFLTKGQQVDDHAITAKRTKETFMFSTLLELGDDFFQRKVFRAL